MDYKKIYSDFIASRKQKTCEWRPKTHRISGYEWHHIIPRSLGGSDHESNLVALTYEDHLFAHSLLAKIHGGKMIVAVCLMANCMGRVTNKRARKAYSLFREQFREINSPPIFYGADNNRHNPNVFEWVNLDTGERLSETLMGMGTRFGNRASFTSVLNGARSSISGWCVLGTEAKKKRSAKGKSFCFINRDGREFIGTQKDFCCKYSISTATASRIVKLNSVSKCGWRLNGGNDRQHSSRKIDGLPPRKGYGKTITIQKGDSLFTGKAHECALVIGCTVQQFHAGKYLILTGKMKTYKGWSVICAT